MLVHWCTDIAARLVREISHVLSDKAAQRISAFEYAHRRVIGFWALIREIGCERDPRYTKYIVDDERQGAVEASYKQDLGRFQHPTTL